MQTLDHTGNIPIGIGVVEISEAETNEQQQHSLMPYHKHSDEIIPKVSRKM